MIRTKRAGGSRQITGINITPFTDVCLVLLIIFMVTASALTKEASVNMDLPKATTSDVMMPSSIIVSIMRDGTMVVNKQPVTLDTLESRLTELQQALHSTVLVVKADQGVPYRMVFTTIDIGRRVGIAKVGLAAQSVAD